MIVVVAICPLIFVVNTFPDTDCENELIIFVTVDAIPFIIDWNVFEVVATRFELIIDEVADIPFIIVWKIFPLDDATFEFMIVVLVDNPLTILVSVFDIDESEFVVVGRSPTIDVVDVTPFTSVVRTPPA